MSKFNEHTRNQILHLFNSTTDIVKVEVKSSRLSSSIFSIQFWHRFAELLYSEKDWVYFVFVLPTNIDHSIFDKIESQLKKVASDLGEYNKVKISYHLDPELMEDVSGKRVDGIALTTSAGERLAFEAAKVL